MSMDRPAVFFSSTLDSPDDWQRALAPELGDFEFIVGPECADPLAVDVALVYKVPVGGLLRFKNLKAAVSLSAGINQFRQGDFPSGSRLCRSVDRSLTQHMVMYARAAALRYLRRFDHFERCSRDGVWKFEPPRLPEELAVGVLGLGELGSAIAGALRDDGFEVHGWSRTARAIPGVTCHEGSAGLDDLASASDIVVNVLPLNAQTLGILDKRLFGRMRAGACLVNMGRGAHVVEDDLLAAIHDGRIAGATLDVTSVEPLPPEHALWRNPKILITPHIAGLTSPKTAAPIVASNIRNALRGAALVNEVALQSLEL